MGGGARSGPAISGAVVASGAAACDVDGGPGWSPSSWGSSGSVCAIVRAEGNLAPVRPTLVVRLGLARRLPVVDTFRELSSCVIPAPFGAISELRTNPTPYDYRVPRR